MSDDLAVWMKLEDKWREVDCDDLYDFAAYCAGCNGRVFISEKLNEIVLLDGSDLVLWRMVSSQKVYDERERCAKRFETFVRGLADYVDREEGLRHIAAIKGGE